MITSWPGRLGNNIIQVRNCLHVALATGANVGLPGHICFNKTYISINGRPKSRGRISDLFLYPGRIAGYAVPVSDDHRPQVRKIIRDLLYVNPCVPAPMSDDKTLVIHIRSGDIFAYHESKRLHQDYIMPPLSFYVRVIEELGTRIDKIHLVAEDTLNPCVELLLRKYSNAVFKKSSLAEDIRLIMGARKIVYGMGTFAPQLLEFFNDSLMEVYRPSNADKVSLLGRSYKDNVIDIGDYIDKMGGWKNTPEQHALMCSYEFAE